MQALRHHTKPPRLGLQFHPLTKHGACSATLPTAQLDSFAAGTPSKSILLLLNDKPQLCGARDSARHMTRALQRFPNNTSCLLSGPVEILLRNGNPCMKSRFELCICPKQIPRMLSRMSLTVQRTSSNRLGRYCCKLCLMSLELLCIDSLALWQFNTTMRSCKRQDLLRW